MHPEIYKALIKYCIYEKKQNTHSSYYFQSGEKFLPNRISITQSEVSKVQKKGRNLLHPTQGQMLGQFTKADNSPFKQNPPYNIRTQIWQWDDIPVLMYGTLGITGENGKIKDDSDLVVFVPDGYQWNRMKIYLLPACGKTPAQTEEALVYCLKLGLTF